VVHNLGQEPREVRFELKSGNPPGEDLINLLSENHSHADDMGFHRILLEPYGYRWYRVGGLDYILRRSDI
jgi:maltose alpha-D-glucosyltransferase/alpha-amylase